TEGQRILVLGTGIYANQARTSSRLFDSLPFRIVKATAQRLYLVGQRSGAKINARPAHVGLRHRPDEALLRQTAERGHIEDQDKRLIFSEQCLGRGKAKRLMVDKSQVVLRFLGQLGLLGKLVLICLELVL